MIKKIKAFLIQKRQLVLYLLFGVVTTVLSLVCCFLTVKAVTLFYHDGEGNPTALADILGSTTQWISGVLIAFYTNKKWVFTEAEQGTSATWKQLAVFSGSRVATYFIEVFVNLGIIALLERALHYQAPTLNLLVMELTLSARLWAKVVSSVIVVISNYYISKLLVFRKKSEENE